MAGTSFVSTVLPGLSGGLGHAHLAPLASFVVPLGTAALVWIAVAGARNQFLTRPSWRALTVGQIAFFLALESVELLGAGEAISGLATRPTIVAGLLAQPLVAWLLTRLIDIGIEVIGADDEPHWREPGRPVDARTPALAPVRSVYSRSRRHRRGPPR